MNCNGRITSYNVCYTKLLRLIGASRRFGRIPYIIDPRLDALVAELRQGRPVLVLQNYGVESLPVYHYSVVIGVRPDETVILRSSYNFV